MKTFKLVSFRLDTKDGVTKEIPFIDSLAINQENERKTWLIEVFIEKRNLEPFLDFGPDEAFFVEVVITDKDNPPASFTVSIKSLKTMDDYASVLMEGKLHRRQERATKILESLINAGFKGEELLEQFHTQVTVGKSKKSESK